MAYFARDVVPGVCLYPAGREPERSCASDLQHFGRMDADGIMARRKLEFCAVGALLRSDFSFGKDLFAEIFKKNPRFFLASLQLAADHIRMGHFRMRIAGRNCLLPESDVFGWRTWLERGNDVCPCQFRPAACCAGRLLDVALRKAREKDE